MTQLFLTTAIDYVNSLPHIGTAYEKIGADVLARFYRMMGHDVLFQMGNDEHSANVQKAAEAQGLAPKKYCDGMRPQFEEIWKKLNISYDQFIQTSDEKHHKMVYEFFERVNQAGDIYEKDYEGWYCESCEAFYLEKDLEEGLCKNHKKKPTWLKEKNYFFRLEKYTQSLLEHIEAHPDSILPAKRRNEVVNFIKQGLQDFSISRSTFTWGIPVPLNKKHVFYVWFDALINYLSLLNLNSLDELENNEPWKNVTHIVGKDITRFHCIIWPAMLMSANLPLPKRVFGHGFVYLKGEKMSKSLGNVVTPLDILNKFPDYGSDALRYYLMRTSSFGDDSDFTWDGFVERYNADLANGIGNLVARTVAMVWRYQDGVVEHEQTSAVSNELLHSLKGEVNKLKSYFDLERAGDLSFHLYLEKVMHYMGQVDQYIDKRQPWTLSKLGNKNELREVLFTIVLAIRQLAILLSPFIPQAALKINNVLGLQISSFDDLFERPSNSFSLTQKEIKLFPRIDMTQENEASVAAQPIPPKVEETNLIDIKEFGKVDLRVAKVLTAEKVEGADKLLKLQVELGSETRQIISGIALHFKPEDLVGKNVIVVANLKPAKIRGVESFGMLLAAKEGDRLVLATTDGPIGSNAKVG